MSLTAVSLMAGSLTPTRTADASDGSSSGDVAAAGSRSARRVPAVRGCSSPTRGALSASDRVCNQRSSAPPAAMKTSDTMALRDRPRKRNVVSVRISSSRNLITP